MLLCVNEAWHNQSYGAEQRRPPSAKVERRLFEASWGHVAFVDWKESDMWWLWLVSRLLRFTFILVLIEPEPSKHDSPVFKVSQHSPSREGCIAMDHGTRIGPAPARGKTIPI